jgi:hypothetical protein
MADFLWSIIRMARIIHRLYGALPTPFSRQAQAAAAVKDPVAIELMRTLKATLDSNGI